MNLTPVLALIAERTGLDPGTLGTHTVESAITSRLRAAKVDTNELAAQLARDPGAFAELICDVVVPETWFFRGGDVFWYLAEHVRATLAQRAGAFRVLSIPCSTGEEPYSLALALAETGVQAERVVIDGVDVSARNVEAARRGVYSEFAFRQTSDLRERYFRERGRGWELDASVRSRVRFQVGNLLDPGFLRFEQPYDLVFCRNLYIYLTTAARRRGMETLSRLVVAGGLLCTGHAEPLDANETRFERTGPEGYFLFRRSGGGGREREREKSGDSSPLFSPSLSLPSPAKKSQERRPIAALDNRPGSNQGPDLFQQARQHADQGRYDEALTLCQAIEQRLGPSADLYTLMGIVHHGREDDGEAGRYFTRALYLAPEHREALMHLMLLSQLQGAHERAAALRRRLERLPPGDPS